MYFEPTDVFILFLDLRVLRNNFLNKLMIVFTHSWFEGYYIEAIRQVKEAITHSNRRSCFVYLIFFANTLNMICNNIIFCISKEYKWIF